MRNVRIIRWARRLVVVAGLLAAALLAPGHGGMPDWPCPDHGAHGPLGATSAGAQGWPAADHEGPWTGLCRLACAPGVLPATAASASVTRSRAPLPDQPLQPASTLRHEVLRPPREAFA